MVLKTLTNVFLLCGNVIENIQFDTLCTKLLELLKYNLKIHSSIIIVLIELLKEINDCQLSTLIL